MGLLDVLTGMQNGPRGFRGGGGGFGGGLLGGGGGMSPITGAVLGLLAYKAIKSFSGSQQQSSAPGAAAIPATADQGGSIGDVLRNGLKSVLGGGGAGAGGALSGGLGDLLQQFKQAGRGDVADSWVARGANLPIPPHDLEKVLTPDQVTFLTQRTGLSREQLMAGLSEQLPKAVDHLTPEGRLPTDKEVTALI